jgi:amino-acid N-acetyltransferase
MATPDLRNVLGYVRRFRDKVFVIAIDGSVIADDNFSNVLMDIAALHSLSIRIVIVHGAAAQIRDWSESRKEPVTDVDGTMPADAATLRVARLAAGQVSNQVLDGLYATNQIRGAVTPAVKAKPAGVIKGVDHLYRGRVDQVDKELLDVLLRHDIVPVVPPIGTDALGQAFRLNSDDVAQAVARALGATKLVFLTDRPGVTVKGQLLRQVTSAHLDEMLKTQREALEPSMISKMEAALEACQAGVRRSHIIDGRVDE